MTSRSVVEQATDELRRAILAGVLAPGAEYSLRELAGMLDISFIPIREALRSLESEGLVIMRPGRSAVVTPLDLDDLHGIYRLRRALEPEIARRSCGLLADEELDRLAAQAADFGARDHGMGDIYDDHHAFHLALLAPAATAWDIRVLTTLWQAAERYIRIGFGQLDPDPAEHQRRGKAHVDLVAAFRTRDPDTVAAAVEQHLARNEKIASSALS
ncbi:FCD domain-containing protein [Streptomyces sp. 3MP-14]|uniref:FCD domain-containing protein n=1 Tax=Streptomyces mimosae TaxID=2586635 RepID=A0A5N5ZSL4_9ACTN|nr:FCD domain-containing protein [Streptomyces mimosae]KAB8172676.1 FCD domain-containing protein [Streptomyces sp. 3MP-14]